MAIKEEIRALYSMIGIDEHPTRTHAYTGSTYNKWTDSATMSQRSKGDDTKVHKNGYNNVHIKTSMSTGNLHVQSTDHCVLIPPRNDTDYSERDSSSTLLMCTDYTDDRSANLMNSAQLYPGFSSDNILDNGLIGRAKHFNCKTNNQNSHTPQCAVNNKLHVDTEIFNCDTPDTEPLDKVGCGNLHVNNGVYSNNINTSPSEVSAIARYSLSNYKNMDSRRSEYRRWMGGMQTPLSLIHRHEDLKHRVEFRPARKSCAPVKMYASEPNINKLPKICTTPKPANELMINRDLINEAHRDNDHDLVFLRQLGSGAFSKVYLVNDKTCDKLAVCKRIKASSVKYVVYDEEARGMIPYELHVLKNLRCHDEYFVSFHRWMRVNNEYFIMMNYLGDNWMDMYDYLCSTKGPENAYQVKEIFGKVLDAAYFLHLCGLTHNDIKDENIMINKYTRDIKLADFGSVLPITRAPLESFLGTRKYASPQVLNNIPYNQILQESWALGVLLFAISFRVEPFRNADDIIMKDINYVILVTRKMFLDTANGFYVTDDITDAIASLMHKEERLRTSFTDLRNSSPFARYCRKIL